MFNARFFPGRYFAPRYFPETGDGGGSPTPTPTGGYVFLRSVASGRTVLGARLLT